MTFTQRPGHSKILEFLKSKSSHGYEIAKNLNMSQGNVVNYLKDLESVDFITNKNEVVNGRTLKIFCINSDKINEIDEFMKNNVDKRSLKKKDIIQ